MISNLTIALMVFTAIFSIALPVVLLILFKKRHNTIIQPFFMGAITYVVFAIFLQSYPNQIFLNMAAETGHKIMTTPAYYALYIALTTGILEELGRFFCMAILMKNIRREESVVYGLGHAAVEALIGGTWAMFQNVTIAVALNRFGSIEAYASQAATPEQAESISTMLTDFANTSSGSYLVANVERISFLLLQVSLSILIYKAIYCKKHMLIPIAMVLHGAALFLCNYYQKAPFTNIYILELILLVYAVLVAFFAYKQYQSMKQLSSDNA